MLDETCLHARIAAVWHPSHLPCAASNIARHSLFDGWPVTFDEEVIGRSRCSVLGAACNIYIYMYIIYYMFKLIGNTRIYISIHMFIRFHE